MIFFMAVWPQHASGELDTFSGARAVAFVSTATPLHWSNPSALARLDREVRREPS